MRKNSSLLRVALQLIVVSGLASPAIADHTSSKTDDLKGHGHHPRKGKDDKEDKLPVVGDPPPVGPRGDDPPPRPPEPPPPPPPKGGSS
jgi:hypothetical protein